jgi:hypothetical protein
MDGNQLFQGEGLGVQKVGVQKVGIDRLAASRGAKFAENRHGKFPSVEVLSRYTDPLLPTCCQHRQHGFVKRDKRRDLP